MSFSVTEQEEEEQEEELRILGVGCCAINYSSAQDDDRFHPTIPHAHAHAHAFKDCSALQLMK